MGDLFLLSLIVSALYYYVFLLRVSRGLATLSRDVRDNYRPRVSVVVAAKNEEQSIKACIDSLLQQEYPNDLVEFIIVDDGSTDATLRIIRESAAKDPRVIPIEYLPLPSVTGPRKPLALAQGIAASKGECILSTDADCVVSRGWIRAMLGAFDEHTAFVAGPVAESTPATFLGRLGSLEFLGLVSTSAGLIGAGTPIICNGANIAFRRSAFIEAGGFGTQAGFCDDEVIMQRIHTRNLGRITFTTHPDALVMTSPPETIPDLVFQRIRWASKRGHYEDKTILARLSVIYLFFFFLLLAFVVAPFNPLLLPIAGFLFLLKVALELRVLRAGARMFRQDVSLSYFLVAQLFHVPYIVLAAFAGQFFSIRWKGKSIRE